MKKYFNKFLFSLIIIFSIFFIASCNNEDENVASSSEIRENKYTNKKGAAEGLLSLRTDLKCMTSSI